MNLMKYEAQHLRWRVEGRVGFVTLDRPERKHALTFDSYAELRDIFRALALEPAIKAVMLSGAAGNFCSGGDMHDIVGPLTEGSIPQLLAFTRMTGDVVLAMRRCPQPIIAAVDGVCVGAGAILAMASDMRFGTERTRIAFLFTRVGLAGCDMGACAILPRIIGHGRAAELLYTGRIIEGPEAERWGFLNRLCTPEMLLEEATLTAGNLASGPTFAHAITKTQLHMEWSMSLEQALEAEAQAQALCMGTEDFRRAYEAFVAKRKPAFEGD